MIINKTQSHRIEQLTVKVQLHACEKITVIIKNLASKHISVFYACDLVDQDYIAPPLEQLAAPPITSKQLKKYNSFKWIDVQLKIGVSIHRPTAKYTFLYVQMMVL